MATHSATGVRPLHLVLLACMPLLVVACQPASLNRTARILAAPEPVSAGEMVAYANRLRELTAEELTYRPEVIFAVAQA